MSSPVTKKDVFRKFCNRASCLGLERHFEGTCHRLPAVVTRRAKWEEAKREREERHAAFLVRQARRDAVASRLAKKPEGKVSEVSTEVGDDCGVPLEHASPDQQSICVHDGDDWSVPQPDVMVQATVVDKSGDTEEDWSVPQPEVKVQLKSDDARLEVKSCENKRTEPSCENKRTELSASEKEKYKQEKKLEKKLREIAKIEQAMEAGEAVDKLQQKKVGTKGDLLAGLRKLQSVESSAPQKSAPQKSAPQKSAPQKSAPQKTAPQRTAPQKTADPQSLTKITKKVNTTQHALTTSRPVNTTRAAIGELAMPTAGCRVHFSGCLMFDQQIGGWCSVPYVEDTYSEYVGRGRYNSNKSAFPKAIGATFDGVAVDAGTRVTIYSEPDFKGKVLWDRVGPAIVVNSFYKDHTFHKGRSYEKILKQKWEGPLEVLFPPEVREFSVSNMHNWASGSLIIQDGQSIPKEVDDITEYVALPNPRY